MPNIKITDLPNAILPMDLTNTFFEVQTIEAGIPVSRRASGDQLTFTTDDVIKGTSSDDPAVGGGVFDGTQTWQNSLSQQTASVGFDPSGVDFIIQNFAQGGEVSLRVRDGTVHLVTADYGANIPTTGAFKVPVGTTGEEPAPVNGQIRYDSDNNRFRGVISGTWVNLDTGAVALNDLTDVTLTAPATGAVLYKSAGDWIDTEAIVIDPTGSIDLFFNTALKLSTVNGGIDVLGSTVTAPSAGGAQNTAVLLKNLGGTVIGYLGMSAQEELTISNAIHGANIQMTAQDDAGAVNTLLVGDPDAGLDFYWDDVVAFGTEQRGAFVSGSFDADDPTLFWREGSTDRAFMFYDIGLNRFIVQTIEAGAQYRVVLRNNADDGDNIIFLASSDGAVQQFYDGSSRTETATFGFTIFGTGAIQIPDGTTGEEPTPANGMIRYDTTTNVYRGVISGSWADLAGGSPFTEVIITNSNVIDLVDTDVALNLGAADPDSAVHLELGLFSNGGGIQAKLTDTTVADLFINPLGETTWIGPPASAAVAGGFNLRHANGAAGGGNIIESTISGIILEGRTGSNTILDFHAVNANLAWRFVWDGSFFNITSFVDSSEFRINGRNSSAATRELIHMDPDGDIEIFDPLSDNSVFRTVAPASGGVTVNNTSTGAGFERVLTTADLGGGGALDDLSDVTLTTEATGDVLYKSAGDWLDTSAISVNPAGAVTLDFNATGSGLRSGATGVEVIGSSTSVSEVLLYANDGSTLLGDIVHVGGSLRVRARVNNESASLWSRTSGGVDMQGFQISNTGIAQAHHQNNIRFLTSNLGITVRGGSTTTGTLLIEGSGAADLFRIGVAATTVSLVSDVDSAEVLIQGQSSASALRTMAQFDPDEGVDLFWDNTVFFSVVSSGVDILAPLLDIDNSGSTAPTGLRTRNSEGGFEIRVDGDDTEFFQTASNAGQEDLLLKFFNNDRTEFFFNGVFEAATQSHNADHTTSGLTVEDHGGAGIDVGFNLMPVIERDTSLTFAELQVSKMIHRDSTADVTFTLASGTTGAVPPVGSVIMITNENATGTVTIAAAGTLLFLEGTGAPGTGNRVLAHGGIATVYHYSDTEWWIWGIGIS